MIKIEGEVVLEILNPDVLSKLFNILIKQSYPEILNHIILIFGNIFAIIPNIKQSRLTISINNQQTSFENILLSYFTKDNLIKIPNYLKENLLWCLRLMLNSFENTDKVLNVL